MAAVTRCWQSWMSTPEKHYAWRQNREWAMLKCLMRFIPYSSSMESHTTFVLTMALSLLPATCRPGLRRWVSSRSKSIPEVRGRIATMNASTALSGGSSQRRMVLNHQTGADRHQYMAKAVQLYPPTSGLKHETSSAGNSTTKWYIEWGLDTRTFELFSALRS